MSFKTVAAVATLAGLTACGGSDSVMPSEATPSPRLPLLTPGTYFQLAGTPFFRVEVSGATTALGAICQTFTGADLDPNGATLAVSPADSNVREVDPVSGRCEIRFATPVPMKAVAVAADGAVVTVSAAQQFGQDVMYVFAPNGRLIVYNGVSGAGYGDGSLVGGLRAVEGMDFAPDGSLYVSDRGSLFADQPGGLVLFPQARLWKIDAMTGSGSLLFLTAKISSIGDFDIGSDGILRTLAAPLKTVPGNYLISYRFSDLSLLTLLALDRTTPVSGAVVHR